jgi:hypothetical protein
MRRFEGSELRQFVVALDRHVEPSTQVIVIGGSAVALGYGIEIFTKDIDTFQVAPARLRDAIAKAREETGLPITVDNAAIAEFPYDFEDRLVPAMEDELENLVIFVPEANDLSLSKLIRASDSDLDQIVLLHDAHPLDVDALINRFLNEMTHVIGNRRMQAYNLLDCIERLWGERTRERVQERVLSVR